MHAWHHAAPPKQRRQSTVSARMVTLLRKVSSYGAVMAEEGAEQRAAEVRGTLLGHTFGNTWNFQSCSAGRPQPMESRGRFTRRTARRRRQRGGSRLATVDCKALQSYFESYIEC